MRGFLLALVLCCGCQGGSDGSTAEDGGGADGPLAPGPAGNDGAGDGGASVNGSTNGGASGREDAGDGADQGERGDGGDAGGAGDPSDSVDTRPTDCHGVPGGDAREDMCGTCDADPDNDCVQDCAGSWGGSAAMDKCGICDRTPGNDCVQDCAGTWGGRAAMDKCGICDASTSNDCVQDCAGTWGGNATEDNCGTCDTNAADDCVQDCAGTWGGNATEDNCGTCDTNAANDCVQDCAGTWGGNAMADCAGTCEGAAKRDACGTCDTNPDNDCDEAFILDISTHLATPETNPIGALGLDTFVSQFNTTRFPWIERTPGTTGSAKYDRAEYVAQVLTGSDTDVGMLTGLPYSLGANGSGTSGFAAVSNEDLFGALAYLESNHPGRTLGSCMVMPNDRIDVQLSMMENLASSCVAWHTVTAWSTGTSSGYWLDQGVGPMMIQKGIDLGRPVFLVSKGLPLSGYSAAHVSPVDVGPAAKMFPDATFVILHSAFDNGLGAGESSEPGGSFSGDSCDGSQRPVGSWPEGPYDESDPNVMAQYPLERGVNSLIASLRGANIGPNGKDLDNPSGPVTTQVYASLDGIWAYLMTGRNEEAMHVLGKLLLHVGEDRILWGTDSLWFGGPQPQIDAFNCFEISQAFQTTYGYPALTPQVKAKILGLNAAAMLSQLPDVDLP